MAWISLRQWRGFRCVDGVDFVASMAWLLLRRWRGFRCVNGAAFVASMASLPLGSFALQFAECQIQGIAATTRMDGVEFLQQAMGIFPGAKRALLTAYADTNAAISAITINEKRSQALSWIPEILSEPHDAGGCVLSF